MRRRLVPISSCNSSIANIDTRLLRDRFCHYPQSPYELPVGLSRVTLRQYYITLVCTSLTLVETSLYGQSCETARMSMPSTAGSARCHDHAQDDRIGDGAARRMAGLVHRK